MDRGNVTDSDTGKASVWRLEAKNMAVTEDGEELAFINEDEIANCIGSRKYAICTKAIPLVHIAYYRTDLSVLYDYFTLPRSRATCIATMSTGPSRIAVD